MTMADEIILDLGNAYIGSAYSPTVEVSDVEGGHMVTITSADPEQDGAVVTQEFTVLDGGGGAGIVANDLGLVRDEETGYVYPTLRGVASENGVPIAEGIIPEGNRIFTKNVESADVARYATATVAVPSNIIVIYFDANGGDGDVPDPLLAVKYGTSQDGVKDTPTWLPRGELQPDGRVRWWPGNGKYLAPPEGKRFDGWSLSHDNSRGNYAITMWQNATVYAIWVDE